MGVITGIPLEFQFGTNWSRFSEAAGGVIGQTLAMEGVFAFFLESSFLYLLLFGERRLGQRGHWMAALLVFVGSWLSGFFIVCTNAWMQHPVGYTITRDSVIELTSLSALLTNPWAFVQYAHVMVGTTITASFVMASIGAYYLLRSEHVVTARKFLSVAVVVGAIASVMAAVPPGDLQSRMVHRYQPVAFAAMEGHFHTEDGAGLVIIGQPNVPELRLDNPIIVPKMLSFITYERWNARVLGLNEFDRSKWPDNIALLYYSYPRHGRVGDDFRRYHDPERVFSVAWWASPAALATLDPDAFPAVPVHCQHGGLDDNGAGQTTMDYLRSDADSRRLFHQCISR